MASVSATPRRIRVHDAAVRSRRGSRLVRVGVFGGGIGTFALWWSGTPAAAVTTPAAAVTSLGELGGLLAGYLVCIQLLLVARVPWFERFVGFDRLVSWHRVVGPLVLGLVVLHVGLIVVGGQLRTANPPWTEFLSVIAQYPHMISALLGTVVVIVAGVSSIPWLRARISRELWYGLHVATYGGIFVTVFHQISGGTHLIADPAARALWILLYLATAAAVVIWRVIVPLRRLHRHHMKVPAVVPEGDNTVSVWIEGDSLSLLKIRAGNFMLFRFFARGHLGTAHPYSVSTIATDELLRITVGGLGDHSSKMAGVRPGTRVMVEGPFGHFTADIATRERILLIAGGVGISPIRALAEEFVARGAETVVIYRARSERNLPLLGELRALDGVKIVLMIGSRAELGFDPLDATPLRRTIPDAHRRETFICGPAGMAERAESSLQALGTPARYIHREEMSMS